MARTSDKGSDEQKLRKCLKDYQEMTFTEMVNYYLWYLGRCRFNFLIAPCSVYCCKGNYLLIPKNQWHKTIVKISMEFWCRFSTLLSVLQFIAFSIRMTYKNNFCIRKGRFHEAPLQITVSSVTMSIRVKNNSEKWNGYKVAVNLTRPRSETGWVCLWGRWRRDAPVKYPRKRLITSPFLPFLLIIKRIASE